MERLNHNTGQLERLLELCKVSAQRIADIVDEREINSLRGNVAKYISEIDKYVKENDDVLRDLRKELKT